MHLNFPLCDLRKNLDTEGREDPWSSGFGSQHFFITLNSEEQKKSEDCKSSQNMSYGSRYGM